MRKQIFWILLLLSAALDAKPLNVSVRAKHAILYNPENGAILFEKGSKEPHYPASIMKMATALFILEGKQIDLDQRIAATPRALETIHADIKQADFLLYPPYLLEHDGVILGLKEGDTYSIRTLLHGLLLESGNDAANVLAEGTSGTIEGFMDELNIFLKKKGIAHTRFQNPSGLHHPAQMTTAFDMAKIASLCFANPTFREMIKTLEFEPPNFSNIKNTNRMLREGKYHYPPMIGGKTGYIASSGYNLVAAAEEKGRQLIVVLMGCTSSEDRFKDAITLFEAAFRQKKESRPLFSKDHPGFKRTLQKAKGPVNAKLEDDITVSYFPAEETEFTAKIIWGKKRLPIHEGDLLGKLVVSNLQGKVVASSRLYAEEEVGKRQSFRWIYFLLVIGLGWIFYKQFKQRRKRIG